MGKISGPLLDRIDLYIEVPADAPAVAYQELHGNETGATSTQMRERLLAVRAIESGQPCPGKR